MASQDTRGGAVSAASHPLARPWVTYGPGVATVAALAAIAIVIASILDGPAAMYALILGIAAGAVARPDTLRRGLNLATGPGLKVAVALLGVRISMETIASLEPGIAIFVAGTIPAGVGFSLWIARRLGLEPGFGLVAGMAVAVCGVSAAFATAAVLRSGDALRRDTVLIALIVTVLSSVAMVAYPSAAALGGLDDRATGFLLGATIHDLAQVIGAGYGVSALAGDTAVVTKLLRIALLAPAVLAIALLQRRQAGAGSVPFPWFILAFGFVALWQTAGLIPTLVSGAMEEASNLLFLTAIVGVAYKTQLRDLMQIESRKFMVVVLHTLALFAAAALVARILG